MAVYSNLKFEDFFHPQNDEEYTILEVFNNMIKRDFLSFLRQIANGQGCMINDYMGFDLPDEDDEENELKDCIEVWEDCGGNMHSCCLSYTQSIELLEIAGKVWLNNNMIKNHCRAINEYDKETIDMLLNKMKKRYLD